MTLTTPQAMHSDLTAALFDFVTSETRKFGKGKKSRFHPNRKNEICKWELSSIFKETTNSTPGAITDFFKKSKAQS